MTQEKENDICYKEIMDKDCEFCEHFFDCQELFKEYSQEE